MISIIENIGQFTALFFLVFIVLWLIGYGAARFFLPPSIKSLSALLAPIWGMALIIAVLTPLSLLGPPLKSVNWLVYVVAAIFTLPLLRSRASPNQTSVIDINWSQLGVIATVLALAALGGSIVIFISPNMAYDSARGSTDLLDYWIVADYANHFGGRFEDYLAQDIFYSKVIEQHLTYGARWGTMTFLSFFSSIVSINNVYILINPIILASKAALVFFFIAVAIKSRVATYPIAILLSATALTYSNLYFTYLSYSVALPIAALCAWTIGVALLETEASKAPISVSIGLLIGVSLVSHAVAFSSLGFVVGLTFLHHTYKNRHRILRMMSGSWRSTALAATALLPYAALYGKQVIDVLLDTGKPANIGWLWTRLPMPQDIFGLGNTLGFDQLGPQFSFSAQALLGAIGLLFFWRGISRIYGKIIIFGFILFALLLLPKYFSEYYIGGNPLASHIIAKMIFSFAEFLIFVIAIGAWDFSLKIPNTLVRKLLIGGWATAAGYFLFLTTPLPIFYERELIDLLRAHKQDAVFFVNTPELDALSQQYRFQPILKNQNKLIYSIDQLRTGKDCGKPFLFVWSGEEALHGTIISSKGKYHLGLPPAAIDFSLSPGTISLISGFDYWLNGSRKLGGSALLVLRPKTPADDATKEFRLNITAISTPRDGAEKADIAPHPTTRVIATINRKMQVSFDLYDGDNEISLSIPSEVITTCRSHTLVQFDVEKTGSGERPQSIWAMKRIALKAVLN